MTLTLSRLFRDASAGLLLVAASLFLVADVLPAEKPQLVEVPIGNEIVVPAQAAPFVPAEVIDLTADGLEADELLLVPPMQVGDGGLIVNELQFVPIDGQQIILDGLVIEGDNFPVIFANGGLVAPEGRDAWLTTILRTTDLDGFRGEQEERLNALIERIDRAANLSLETLQKLQLAGQGDISRFLSECEAVVSAATSREVDEMERAALNRRAQLLRREYQAGLHRGESLFAKMAKSLLDKEQLERVGPVLEPAVREAAEQGGWIINFGDL